MKCTKKKFDKIKAMLVVAEALNSTSSARQERRYYKCNDCNAYHVTSKEFKELTSITLSV